MASCRAINRRGVAKIGRPTSVAPLPLPLSLPFNILLPPISPSRSLPYLSLAGQGTQHYDSDGAGPWQRGAERLHAAGATAAHGSSGAGPRQREAVVARGAVAQCLTVAQACSGGARRSGSWPWASTTMRGVAMPAGAACGAAARDHRLYGSAGLGGTCPRRPLHLYCCWNATAREAAVASRSSGAMVDFFRFVGPSRGMTRL